MLKLAIQIDGEKPVEFKITGSRFTIGRRHDNDFRIRKAFVSAYHAEIIQLDSGTYEIVDQDSFNGTFVNGNRIDRSPIEAGDRIKIGVLKGRVLNENETWDTVAVKPKVKEPVVVPLKERMKTGKNKLPPAKPPIKPESTGGIAPTNLTGKVSPQSEDTEKTGTVDLKAASDATKVDELESRLGKLQEENEKLREKIGKSGAGTRESTANAESEAAIVEQKLESVRVELNEAREKENSLTKEIEQLRSEFKETEKLTAANADDAESALKKAADERQAAIARCESELKESKTREASLKAQIDQLRRSADRLEIVEKELGEARAAVSAEQARNGELLDQLKTGEASEHKALESVRSELAEARQTASIADQRAAELELDLKGREADLRQAREEARTGIVKLTDELASRGRAASEAKASYNRALEVVENRAAELESRLKEIETGASQASEESSARIADLERQLREQNRTAAKAETALTEARAAAEERVAEFETRIEEKESESTRYRETSETRISELEKQLAEKDRAGSETEATLAEVRKAAQKNAGELQAEIDSLKTDRAKLKTDGERRETEAAAVGRTLQAVREDLAGSREEAGRLNSRIEELETEKKALIADSGDLEKIRSDQQETRKSLKEARNSLEKVRAESGEIASGLTEAREKAEKEQAELTARLEAGRKRVEERNREVEEADDRAAKACQARDQAESRLATSRSELERVSAEFSNREKSRIAADEEVQRLTAERDELQVELADLTRNLALITTDIDSKEAIRKQLDGAEKRFREIEKREAQVIDRELKLDGLATEEKALKNQLRELEESINRTEHQFQDAGKKLDRKLHELKLAEDRIQRAVEMNEDIEERELRRDALDAELEIKERNRVQLVEEELKLNAARTNGSHTEFKDDEERLAELKSRIREYEEYGQILRNSVKLENGTVQIMSRQIIQKLDLIEDLIGHYRKRERLRVVEQLTALRDSFRDMLKDNSIQVFTFEPGTELSLDHRRRIKIVESSNGANGGNGDVQFEDDSPPEVLETVRPGYVCNDPESGEKVLRKAEVITRQ